VPAVAGQQGVMSAPVAVAEDSRDEGDGVGVFCCAGVGVVVGAQTAVMVDGLDGEQPMRR
jgi:hypothetical protein